VTPTNHQHDHRSRRPLTTATPANECVECQELQTLIAEYIEGEAGREECAQLMIHITTCRECATLVRSLKRVVHYCRLEPGCDVPTAVHEQLWQFIQTKVLSRDAAGKSTSGRRSGRSRTPGTRT
jgi:hypothetical protein